MPDYVVCCKKCPCETRLSVKVSYLFPYRVECRKCGREASPRRYRYVGSVGAIDKLPALFVLAKNSKAYRFWKIWKLNELKRREQLGIEIKA